MKNNDDISTMKDPFSHGMPLINFDWIKMYLFGLILIPLRIFAILVLSTAIWLVVTLALWKLKDEERNQRPLCGWRKRCKKFIQFLARLVHTVMGFKVELRGLYSNEAAILIALPHTTLFDIFLPHWIENMPCTVTRIKNRKMPVIGKMMDLCQAIYVARDDPKSRQNTIQEISRRAISYTDEKWKDRWPQTLLFPEGTTCNGKVLLSFKKGAFVPGLAIQPIIIRYPNRFDTVTWTYNSAVTVFFKTLAMPYTRVEFEFLPVYTPTSEERESPDLFAFNVRMVIAEKLKIPTLDMTFERAVQMFHGKVD